LIGQRVLNDQNVSRLVRPRAAQAVSNTILYLSTSSGPGGAERLVNKLAVGFTNESFRSVVCLFRPGWVQQQCEADGIPTTVIPNKGAFDIVWLKRFITLIRKEQVRLIHAHEFDAIVHGTLAAVIARIPIVATIHGKNYYWEKSTRRVAYRLASRCARVVAVSENLKRFVTERTGIPARRIRVIYNGIDSFPDIHPHEQARLRNEIGLDNEDQIVGTVGSLYPIKGHRFLIEAIPAIIRACPRARFLLVGRGDQEIPLKEQVKRLGIERYVYFLGLRQDINRLLSIMDVFVLPSLSEGLSVATLEAMASAKPVIATRVGGNPELVVEGETGMLVPSEDDQALVRSIVGLLSDTSLARRLGQRGRARVEQRFQLQMMLRKYQELYEECLGS
jgi:glycosyltransferase involved in cell wall biosynthesis